MKPSGRSGGRRGLLPDEEQLWRRVADTAVPLHPRPFRLPEAIEPAKPVPKPRPNPRIETFRIGEAGTGPAARHELAGSISDQLAATPVRMDRKAFDQMARGKLVPEGRIDLHGMTLSQAHPVLTRFVIAAHGQGKRLILVITGKGKRGDDVGPIPQRQGVLKHAVPQWLGLPPLGSLVLQVAEAHLKHGGGGAYYVYLRRQR